MQLPLPPIEDRNFRGDHVRGQPSEDGHAVLGEEAPHLGENWRTVLRAVRERPVEDRAFRKLNESMLEGVDRIKLVLIDRCGIVSFRDRKRVITGVAEPCIRPRRHPRPRSA